MSDNAAATTAPAPATQAPTPAERDANRIRFETELEVRLSSEWIAVRRRLDN